eukprot:5786142-Prymnesium_polylepis.1
MLRRAALRSGQPGHASTFVGGLSLPAPSFRPDMHGATRSHRSMPTGAPFHAHPVGPPDPRRRPCRLDFPPLLAFRTRSRCTGLQSRRAEESRRS